MTAGELRHAEDHMLLLGRKNAMERVASFLLEMDRRLAGSRHDGTADVPQGYWRLSGAHARNGLARTLATSRRRRTRVLRCPADRAPQPAAPAEHGRLTFGVRPIQQHGSGIMTTSRFVATRYRRGSAPWQPEPKPTRSFGFRWTAGNAENYRKYAAELISLAPDVIWLLAVLLRQCSRRPGQCRSCSRSPSIRSALASSKLYRERAATQPGSYCSNAKWMELLKEIAPGVTRAAVLRDPTTTVGVGQFAVIQSVAPSLARLLSFGFSLLLQPQNMCA